VASLYLTYPQDNACPYHRLLLPTRFCCPAFEREGHKFDAGDGMPAGYETYVLHGIPGTVTTCIEIGKAKARGSKFVWSLDDDWLSIPDWNPAKLSAEGIGIYWMMVAMADEFLVSTPELGKIFAAYGKPVHVCPNLLDLTQFPTPPDGSDDGPGRKSFSVKLPVRMAWVGGNTHRGDVSAISGPLDRVLSKFDRRQLNGIFLGQMPPPELVKKHLHRTLTHQPPVPFPLYQATVNSLAPNVWLAPLAEIPFNLSKSNLRVMEGWALNACVVATDFGEYSCVKSGEDGRLCRTQEEWFSGLSRVIMDHEYRTQLAYAGRQRAEAECNWGSPACRTPWVAAFAKMMDVPVPEDS
jgi:hypothetical protein